MEFTDRDRAHHYYYYTSGGWAVDFGLTTGCGRFRTAVLQHVSVYLTIHSLSLRSHRIWDAEIEVFEFFSRKELIIFLERPRFLKRCNRDLAGRPRAPTSTAWRWTVKPFRVMAFARSWYLFNLYSWSYGIFDSHGTVNSTIRAIFRDRE